MDSQNTADAERAHFGPARLMGRAGLEYEASWVAWVRIHDGALTHPKVVGIFDPRRAFDLWVWGLTYSQAHLTDGFIPKDAIPRGCKRSTASVLKRGLWHEVSGGYRIHDFLDWNDDRATVRDRQEKAKQRLKRFRKRVAAGEGNGVANASSSNGEPNQTEPNQTK